MPGRKRIMMISTHGYVSAEPELGRPDTGGQVVYVLELGKCLGRMGFQVDILTRRFEDQARIEAVADRVRVIRFPCGGRDFIPKETLHRHIPEWVTNARRYIESKRLRYRFVSSHYWDAGLAGGALAPALGIPHVHTPHSIGSWKRRNMDEPDDVLERKYNFALRIREEHIVYSECDRVLATSAQQRQILTGDYDVSPEKIDVLPPGYDDSRFFPVSLATKAALKTELGLEGRIVLALGRMSHNKGYDLLIRAMPVVMSRLDNARLLLAIGSTEPTVREREQIEELKQLAADLDIADRILFRDYITDEALPDYYRTADVFALSSRYEPFGMTAVEAMACGTPTVITTEGGLHEQVVWGLESIFANPFDPEAFGHAIYKILKYPRIGEQLSKFGSQKARGHFTWSGIAQQLLRLLDDVRVRKTDTRGRARSEHEDSCQVEACLLAT